MPLVLYCSTKDIASGDSRLLDTHIAVDLELCAHDATRFVRNDLATLLDLDRIETEAIPGAINLLATCKGKELAFRRYWKDGAPENCEIEQYRDDYNTRLAQMRKDIERGLIDRNYKKPTTPDRVLPATRFF